MRSLLRFKNQKNRKTEMKKISENFLYQGRWLSLKRNVFTNSEDKEVVWESVERNNNSFSIGIIAKLTPLNRYILIKQFRQAINNYVIGLPAGIIDPSITSKKQWDDCILQELKEETGYTGTIKAKSPMLKLNPATMNNDFIIVSVEINENDPVNINTRQRLEPAEEIELALVEQTKIKTLLLEQKKQGADIGSGLWFLLYDLN